MFERVVKVGDRDEIIVPAAGEGGAFRCGELQFCLHQICVIDGHADADAVVVPSFFQAA